MRLILLISLMLATLNASYIKWQSDYEMAHREAVKENKHLLILLVDKPSSALIQASFINQEYIQEINREFIAVYVKKNQKVSYPVELLYTLEYPALFFLDKYELPSCEVLSGDLNSQRIKKRLKECYTHP